MVHVLLKPSFKNFEHYFGSKWDECNCVVFEHSLALLFFGIGMKTPFPVLWPCWVFQIFWHIECSTFPGSPFRIWNSSTGISSPPQALFVAMLPKAHLTSHSRMSTSRWVITPSWLSGSWRYFLHSSFVYSCHLFLISSASVRSIPFLSFIVPIFAWNVLLIALIFLKSSLVFPNSIVFLYFFALITEEGFIISPCYSLELCIQTGMFSSLLFTSLLFTAICKASSDSHFAFLHFFFKGMVLFTASYTKSRTSIHSSSGTLSIRYNPFNLFVTFTV